MWRRKPDSLIAAAAAKPAEVRERALGLLARREHSLQELTRKLLERGLPEELVGETVAQLAAEGLLSNARYADVLTRTRRQRGHGPRRIQAELRQRGLGADEITPAMEAEATDWVTQARAAREKRFGPLLPSSHKERIRQTRFLAGRGFTTEQIRQALGEVEDS
ncbi:MAG: regulatory protein RecX [Nevskiales bacterium]